ncbi:hypothetical protein AB0P21_40735 [Kribbella sp. NPDC056861]|uniref:hypothetical protein n=1 Tax=Kribbella sp. NPDC056861 TaxID=3154857 RepID=UPI00344A1BED
MSPKHVRRLFLTAVLVPVAASCVALTAAAGPIELSADSADEHQATFRGTALITGEHGVLRTRTTQAAHLSFLTQKSAGLQVGKLVGADLATTTVADGSGSGSQTTTGGILQREEFQQLITVTHVTSVGVRVLGQPLVGTGLTGSLISPLTVDTAPH